LNEEEAPPLSRHSALRHVRALLDKADQAFAPFSCPGTAECCQLSVTRRQPWLWPAEWALLENHLLKAGRLPLSPRADGGCPLLDADGKRCTVYEVRPFGCRTFFCHRVQGPARQPAQRVDELQKALAALSARMEDESPPRPLMELLLP